MISSLTAAPAWLRTLLVALLVFILAYSYAYIHFIRDPGSAFFDPSRAYDRFYSNVRQEQAAAYGSDAASQGFKSPDSKNASICAVFMTVARQIERQYLLVLCSASLHILLDLSDMIQDSVGSLLEGMTSDERADLHLKLFFAELDPKHHPSFEVPWLRSVADEIVTYADITPSDALDSAKSFAEQHMLHDKGALDYSLALQRCLETTNAPLIAVFEDDVLVARGWLARTLLSLRSVDDVLRRSGQLGHDWLGVRLFNQERSTGWISRSPGGNHELLITAVIDMALFLGLFLLHRYANRLIPSPGAAAFIRRYSDIPTSLVLTLLVVPAFVLLFFQSGKASLLPPSAGLKIEHFGCCSQAMIFNRRQVSGFINFLQLQAGTAPYDILTAAYAASVSLERLALYPMQVQHVGITSAMGAAKEESVQVWSMAFEKLDPHWIDESHAAAVKELYGTPS